MGVLGLTPFIQKTCPEVIKRLPDRLQGFSGKRIALDGTLLTQRFHFAQIPHPYRHVLGWYRLIKELEQFGVEAICVFDGKGRNLAKAQEASRRKNAQRLTAARAVIENERLARLLQISRATHDITKLSSAEKAQVSTGLTRLALENLGKLKTGKEDIVSLMNELALEKAGSDNLSVVDADPWRDSDSMRSMEEWSTKIHEPYSNTTTTEMEDVLRSESSTVTSFTSLTPEQSAESQSAESEAISQPIKNEVPFSKPPRPVTKAPETSFHLADSTNDTMVRTSSGPMIVDGILSTLTPLFLEYQNSIPKVASNPIRASKPPITHPKNTDLDAGVNQDELDADVVREVHEMSKRQCELTLQEGKFWDSLTSTLSEPKDAASELPSEIEDDGHQEILQELTNKSNSISESYRNSTHPPTAQTYAECKEILQVMGVPCFDCDGPFEAEALASSLVLNGYADYVASEDTDVIIYEVPLIRNITSRQQPLLVISGAELRSMLNLTRSMFVDLALLMGTDFSQRIRQVGPMRALEFIRAHESIENVINAETRYQPRGSREDYLKQVNMARKVFQTLPPVPEDAVVRLRNRERNAGRYDAEQVLLIMGKYGLSREVVWDSEDALKGNYFDDDPGQWYSSP
ncbi:PIN domain-like protein [Lentinula guzmanii]|uniref:Exonuclease 1 n=1 Tax=Lentinula guzmanii TaxID=2804957 RepID=A0AA38JV76_9AGAR|nr:PIN domain-like protein [Lentinula guzmanii]